MAARPASAAAWAASGSVTIGPLAIPGDAGRPRASGRAGGRARLAAVGGWASNGATRSTASARVSGNAGSSAMSTAIRSAACGLRLPTRTWSIQSRPSSIVNSMSHMSAKWRSRRVGVLARGSAAAAGRRSSSTAIGSVRWVPATTSSPWASNRTSP